MTVHAAKCRQWRERLSQLEAEYDQTYPDRCRHCNGTGRTGSGLYDFASGRETRQSCVACQGACSLCGASDPILSEDGTVVAYVPPPCGHTANAIPPDANQCICPLALDGGNGDGLTDSDFDFAAMVDGSSSYEMGGSDDVELPPVDADAPKGYRR